MKYAFVTQFGFGEFWGTVATVGMYGLLAVIFLGFLAHIFQ